VPQELILAVRRQEEKSQADGSQLVDCILVEAHRCQQVPYTEEATMSDTVKRV